MLTEPNQQLPTGGLKNLPAEAAHYALLRHLAPAIRHHVAGALQPVSMMAALLHKRLLAIAPAASPALVQSAGDIKTLSQDAAVSCVHLMSWMQPGGRQKVMLNVALEEALSLVKTEMAFRGFQLVDKTAGTPVEVNKSVFGTVFLASLIAMSSACAAPGDVGLTAHVVDQVLVMTLQVTSTGIPTKEADQMTRGLQGSQNYRPLDRSDVQALADAEGVGVEWFPNRVDLRFNLQHHDDLQG